jgi:hypothetical protein
MEVREFKACLSNNKYEDALLHLEYSTAATVRLEFDNYDSGAFTANSIYQAMQKLHAKLDQDGIKLLCNCFRLDVKPSGMSIGMGGGIKAYKMEIGKHATELVDIFEPVNDVNLIASVSEQKEYFMKWVNSPRK